MGMKTGSDPKALPELCELLNDPQVKRMKGFCQHGRVNTYDHCLAVANLSAAIDRKLGLNSRRRTLLRGAMLHDYYLYDWHNWGGHGHGFSHPHRAAENARRDFRITEEEAEIIESHMWPLTLTHVPHSREAWIVCIADKICSLKETLTER